MAAQACPLCANKSSHSLERPCVRQVARLQMALQEAAAGRAAFAGQPTSSQLRAALQRTVVSATVAEAAKEQALLFKGALWHRL